MMQIVLHMLGLWPPFGTDAAGGGRGGPAYHVDAGQLFCPGVDPGRRYSGGSLAGQVAA